MTPAPARALIALEALLAVAATELERRVPLPGDELVPHPQLRGTRAITIDAAPEHVWPLIEQLGSARAGWYGCDPLDQLGGSGRPRAVFTVRQASSPSLLLLAKPDSSWVWLLRPDAAGRTRLVTRLQARSPGPAALLSAPLLRLAGVAMMRRGLLAVRERAERPGGPPVRPAARLHPRWPV